MTYLPVSAYSIMTASNIKSVAIARKADGSFPPMLCTGGAEPEGIFLEGENQGFACDLINFPPVPMLVIMDIDIEVDPETSFNPETGDKHVGGIIISDIGLRINVLREAYGGFKKGITVDFNGTGQARGASIGEVGFKSWRAVKRVGDEKFEVFKFTSTRISDR